MSRDAALRSAISLVSVPSQVRAMRAAPLPEGTGLLLGVAVGDEAALDEAMALTGRPRELLSSAAAFFIEQILLVPEADSYRVLGAAPAAETGELRTHMALMMKWLHPDVDGVGQKALFAARVTRAWEDLKTPERRQAYDAIRSSAVAPPKKTVKPRKYQGQHRQQAPAVSGGFMTRVLSRLLNRGKPLR